MAGAVGIVFGLCVLSFTAGAVLMYVVVRRREESAPEVAQEVPAAAAVPEPQDEQLELRWHDPEYDVRPIHRNPVVGLPPVLEEVVEPEPEPEPETVLSEPEPVAVEPKPEPEPEPEAVLPEPESEPEPKAVLPSPAATPATERTSLPEKNEFRQRYLQTFEAARRRSANN